MVAEIAYEKPSLWLAYHRVFGAPMMLVRMTPTGRVLSSTTFVVPSGEPTDAVFDIHGTHFVRLRYNLTGSEIDVGSLARPLAWKPVWKTTKIVYGIKWISNDQLIVWDGTNRPLLISTTKAPLATLPLDRLTQSNLTGSTVVTIVNRDGRSYVALTNKQH
jgi:hypothetical protein